MQISAFWTSYYEISRFGALGYLDLQYSTVTMKLAGLEHLATWTYSIVQYSTVQYDVKNVTEGRGGKKGRGGPGSVFLVDM